MSRILGGLLQYITEDQHTWARKFKYNRLFSPVLKMVALVYSVWTPGSALKLKSRQKRQIIAVLSSTV